MLLQKFFAKLTIITDNSCSLSLSIAPGDYTSTTVNTTIMFLVGTYFGGGPGFHRAGESYISKSTYKVNFKRGGQWTPWTLLWIRHCV